MADKFIFINHPETTNYGLDCDMDLWAEFNKEILVRNWIKAGRNYRGLPTPKCGPEIDFGTKDERTLANIAIEELVDQGYVNSITFLKEVP